MWDWQFNQIDFELFDLALREDLGESFLDVTTMTLFTGDLKNQQAKIISKAKENIIICGVKIVEELLQRVEHRLVANHAVNIEKPVKISAVKKDGQILKPGEILLTISANPITLLIAERTMLNFLRHLSAIATLTHKFVTKIKHTNCKILDTRKTTPGMRHLEKYAVHCGGGVNHRMGLYDAIMIKDTHVDLIGDMQKTLQKTGKNNSKQQTIVEIRTIEDLKTVIKHGKNRVNRVLLDNMKVEELKECVKIAKGIFELEASGNITLETITEIAETGVDYASIGMLTYNAGQADLSMQAM